MKNQVKPILSFLREGDFTHPGEIDAIELTLSHAYKNKNQSVLDVGSGLGGTAHYLQQKGFGKVTGIDIDHELIEFAKKKYPDVSFIHGDILQAENYLQQKFQLMVAFRGCQRITSSFKRSR